MARDFSKSTTCFSRSPEQKSLFVGMKSMAEIFPFCAFGIQRHLCFVSSPCTLLLFKAAFEPFTSCSHILPFFFFFSFIACHPLCSGKFSQSRWKPHSLSFPSSPTDPSKPPFLKAQFQVSCKCSPTASPTSWSHLCAVCYPVRAQPSPPPF